MNSLLAKTVICFLSSNGVCEGLSTNELECTEKTVIRFQYLDERAFLSMFERLIDALRGGQLTKLNAESLLKSKSLNHNLMMLADNVSRMSWK